MKYNEKNTNRSQQNIAHAHTHTKLNTTKILVSSSNKLNKSIQITLQAVRHQTEFRDGRD